jgi:site-specific recombinase XerD
MVLSEAIRDYGLYCRHEAGHTKNTFRCYQHRQRNFLGWLAEQGHPDPDIHEVTAALVRRYSYSLSARKLRPRTIRAALHALRALFAYLVQMGALSEAPTREVALPKKDAALRLLVTDEDLVQLLEAAGRQHSDFRCVRDRAILAVFIYCGLRRQELLDLTVSPVNLADRSLLVQQGKGQKSRVVPLCEEAVPPLRKWLAMRDQLHCRHDRLFAGLGRRPLGERTLTALIEEIKAIAGMKGDPRVKPHSIRHAAATRLMRNGADIRSIQAWLGHAALQTTAIYLHTDEHQVRKIADLGGPRPPDPGAAPQAEPTKRNDYFRLRRSSR